VRDTNYVRSFVGPFVRPYFVTCLFVLSVPSGCVSVCVCVRVCVWIMCVRVDNVYESVHNVKFVLIDL